MYLLSFVLLLVLLYIISWFHCIIAILLLLSGDIIAPPSLPNDREYNAVITRKWYTNVPRLGLIKVLRYIQEARYNDEQARHFDMIQRELINRRMIIPRRLGIR